MLGALRHALLLPISPVPDRPNAALLLLVLLLQMAAGTASVPNPSLLKKVRCGALLGAVLAAPLVWGMTEAALLLQRPEAGAGGM